MIPLIYRTTTMLEAMSQMEPVHTFLRDRYFPTDPSRDIFTTEDVMMDIRDGVQRMAPVVLPRKKGITVARDGYKTERMTPPLVSPQRTLTLDDLESRGFGEALFAGHTAEEREAAILAQDITDMDAMHNAREEYIAAKCMMNNGYELPQYADEAETSDFIPYEIRFYDGAYNPAAFTPAVPWNSIGATIYDDLCVMVRMLVKDGKDVSDFVGSPDVMDAVLNDDKIYKMLDNRRIELGLIDPRVLPDGASFYGTINVAGRMISLLSYESQFVDDITKQSKPIFAPGEAVLTAPNSGRALYGAIKQIDQDDRQFHTYAATRVPKYTTDVNNDVRTLRIASRPLLTPRSVNPWVSGRLFA